MEVLRSEECLLYSLGRKVIETRSTCRVSKMLLNRIPCPESISRRHAGEFQCSGFLRVCDHPVTRCRERCRGNRLGERAVSAHRQRSDLGLGSTAVVHAAIDEQVGSDLVELPPMSAGHVAERRSRNCGQRPAGGVERVAFDRIVTRIGVVDTE